MPRWRTLLLVESAIWGSNHPWAAEFPKYPQDDLEVDHTPGLRAGVDGIVFVCCVRATGAPGIGSGPAASDEFAERDRRALNLQAADC